MDTAQIDMTKKAAREALKEYRAHRERATDEDLRIMQAYAAIARGDAVIDPFESIRAAGLDDENRPRLAFARADWTHADCIFKRDSVEFCRSYRLAWGWHQVRGGNAITFNVRIDGVSWEQETVRAQVPLVPLAHRPKAKVLNGYHILWEADWQDAPVDPMLLRHLTGHLYVVVAAWDLTPVERAAMRGSV